VYWQVDCTARFGSDDFAKARTLDRVRQLAGR
jgi:hypothetical protein